MKIENVRFADKVHKPKIMVKMHDKDADRITVIVQNYADDTLDLTDTFHIPLDNIPTIINILAEAYEFLRPSRPIEPVEHRGSHA